MYVCTECNRPVFYVNETKRNKRGEYACERHNDSSRPGTLCRGTWARDPYVGEMLQFWLRPGMVERIERQEEKERQRRARLREERLIKANRDEFKEKQKQTEDWKEQERRDRAAQLNKRVKEEEKQRAEQIYIRIARSKSLRVPYSSSTGGA